MVITSTHKKCIDLYICGTRITDICKQCNISRQTFYNWLKDEDFKAELEKRKSDLQDEIQIDMMKKSKMYLSEIEEIALHGKSEATKLNALKYLLDKVLEDKKESKKESIEEKDKNEELSWENVDLKVIGK